MKLQDIFDALTAGEFSQISIAAQPAGVINQANFKQIITHVNLGLAALFRRFHLKENRLVLSLQDGQAMYQLKSDFAVAKRSSRQAVRTILDSADAPFIDDIMKITRVLTDFGVEMKLNDVDDQYSVLTPSLTSLVVPPLVAKQTGATPYWLRTPRLTVIYRAAPHLITVPVGLFDPTRVEIELPYTHLEALLFFVASRVNNPIGMANEFHAGNNYAAKYEQACLDLTVTGIDVEQGAGNTRLHRAGFV